MELCEIINQKAFQIATEHVLLIPLNEKHFCEYCNEFSGEITKYQYPEPFANLEEAEKVLSDFILSRISGSGLVLIIQDVSGRFIGNVEAHNIDTATPEVGVWIAQKYQRKGFAYEALVEMMRFLKKHVNITYFIYEADIRNEGSMHLIQKLKGIKQHHESIITGSGKQLELDTFFIY